jgi:hypothetical protein
VEEHEEKANELEREADDLEQRSDRVGREVEETKSDWEARQADENVPGAVDDETIETAGGGDEREGD